MKRLALTITFTAMAMSIVWGYRIFNIAQVVPVNANIYEPKIVVLDAGHGGFDGGAENKELGIVEKDINLIIAKKLEELLTAAGFKVVMTRSTDDSTANGNLDTIRSKKVSDIHNRFALITKYDNSIAVSIHLNKYPEEYVHGAQVFYSPKAKDSDVLAQAIQDSFASNLQKDNKRTIKPANSSIYILHNNSKNPAVLVECGFISNIKEGKLLLEEQYQSKIAMTIFAGILDYYSRENTKNVG